MQPNAACTLELDITRGRTHIAEEPGVGNGTDCTVWTVSVLDTGRLTASGVGAANWRCDFCIGSYKRCATTRSGGWQ